MAALYNLYLSCTLSAYIFLCALPSQQPTCLCVFSSVSYYNTPYTARPITHRLNILSLYFLYDLPVHKVSIVTLTGNLLILTFKLCNV